MNEAHSDAPPVIFSHPILVDEVPEQGLDVALSADAATPAGAGKG